MLFSFKIKNPTLVGLISQLSGDKNTTKTIETCLISLTTQGHNEWKEGGKMKRLHIGDLCKIIGIVSAFALLLATESPLYAMEGIPLGPGFQCPNDDIDRWPFGWSTGGTKGAEDIDRNSDGTFTGNPNVVCMRLGATDGYAKMPDGTNHYTFGFVDITGVPENEIVNYKFQAHLPAPTIHLRQGQVLFLTLTNLGFHVRPDLDDSHTIHFHGFPHAMAAYDGVPENSFAIPASRDFTYFYKINAPGTYPYHCHFEPVEHIQLGMIGIIVVYPEQDTETAKYAYNDSGLAPDTRYDVTYELLIDELDADKHWNMENIQEGTTLWHTYYPNYHILNGRAYPETVLPDDDPIMMTNAETYGRTNYIAQPSSLIKAKAGQKILLRLVHLGYQTHTLTIPGIPMNVIGEDARILRGPDGKDLSYRKSTYAIEGGKTADIILDTAGLTSGTYFLYGRELYSQSGISGPDRMAGLQYENRMGMITEIQITP